MNFSISDYYDILTKYTNPFAIFMMCVKCAGIAFLFFLLLVIFLRKPILVKRRYLIFKIFAWTYLIVTPLLAAFFGFKWGLIQGVKDDLKTHMAAYTSGMDALLTSSMGKGADEFAKELSTGKDSANMSLSANEAIDKFAELVYANFGATIEKAMTKDGKTSNKIASVFLHITKSATISYGMKAGIRKLLHDKLGIDEGASKELMEKKFQELLHNGLFTSIMQVQTDNFFGRMQKGIYYLFALILLFPIVETVVSNILYRRKLKEASLTVK